MFKRKIGISLIISLMIFSLVACSGTKKKVTEDGANGKITMTMWHIWGGGHEAEALQSVIDEYQNLHPNIVIQQTPVNDMSKVLTAISGGNPPDILDIDGSVIGEWASKGALTDLTPFIEKDTSFKKDVFISSGLQTVTYKGKLYGLPFMNFNAALIYNKKLFADAGITTPPATLEQLAEYAHKLTKVNDKGEIQQMGFLPNYPGASNGQMVNLINLGWLFGGGWYEEASNTTTADRKENVDALKWEQQFYSKYGAQNVANFEKSAGAYLTKQDLFESGHLAMVYDGPWAIKYIEENNPDVAKDIGVVPFPAPADKAGNTGTSFINTNAQVIPVGSKHQEEAWKFISWFTANPEVTAKFADMVANLPQLKKVNDFKLASDARFQVFMKIADSNNAHVWPQIPVSKEYFSKLAQLESQVLLGGDAAESALTQLNVEIGKNLSK